MQPVARAWPGRQQHARPPALLLSRASLNPASSALSLYEPDSIVPQPSWRRRFGAGRQPRLAPAAATAPNTAAAPASSARDASPSATSRETARGEPQDWKQQVLSAMATAEGFAELTIRAKVANAQPWHTVTVRPVTVKGARHLQVTTFTARQSLAANHPAAPGDAAAAEAVVRPLLEAAGVGSVAVRSMGGDLAVQITKKGKGIVHRTAAKRPALVTAAPGATPDAAPSHDRSKALPIPAGRPHPFLQRTGFQTEDGRIRAHMQDKFAQVNDFLRLLSHTPLIRGSTQGQGQGQQGGQGGQGRSSDEEEEEAQAEEAPSSSASELASAAAGGSSAPAPLHILDCGCGSSHLTFGTYHYLNHVLGRPATLSGVDSNAGLMARAEATARQLGLGEEEAFFRAAAIGDYSPPVRPDIVLALHACDTATDDALALAVKQSARLIMAVPCCHQDLQKQVAASRYHSKGPDGLRALMRHGILRQRQIDLVTDSLRAALLRVAGYSTDVVEFVSAEHTPRNLLIRASLTPGAAAARVVPDFGNCRHDEDEAGAQPGPATRRSRGPSRAQQRAVAAAREYLDLRNMWGVKPRLEVLLQDQVDVFLRAAGLQYQIEDDGKDALWQHHAHNRSDLEAEWLLGYRDDFGEQLF
ncbi:hypothetical protein HYH03_014777 [Edaphochlamys debaryana]|uniref:Methyltransferase domain-containing protein n=1 Tax=Edaphochlamys debaryana TaxID=47281 RepID=A0A836BT90_9CHLO|nr:hypothetical protein HYH03_014777 [Edaphochlamys debaryana]|eukprot:KAG2486609.1 hypothetical protein HYH03_014777 [Edaphochlamys debaryana]